MIWEKNHKKILKIKNIVLHLILDLNADNIFTHRNVP
jgi:hypothetical protein